MKKSKFWKKVEKCKHEWSGTYNPDVYCSTPYCSGWENHCIKCGVYESGCECGDSGYGLSGWSSKRWGSLWKPKTDRRLLK